MKVSWFSAGVSSAVATKLSNPDVIIYSHIDDQHPDTMRFLRDCEEWFGKKILITQSPYKTVETACRQAACITMRHFAPCTKFLKIRERKLWEAANPGRHTYVWGFDKKERSRMQDRVDSMPDYDHEFPLKNLTKQDCHAILKRAGIARPQMYDLGFPNNNCIGCVRAEGKGYWNKIRELFPEVFAARAKMERLIGHSIMRHSVNGVKMPIFLDELKPGEGRGMKIILEDCGAACELVAPTYEAAEIAARAFLSSLKDKEGGV